MLEAWATHIGTLSEDPQNVDILRAILEVVANDNTLAASWRRLLVLGREHPGTLGAERGESARSSRRAARRAPRLRAVMPAGRSSRGLRACRRP